MTKVSSINPTERTYGALNAAYVFFNKTLFAGALPSCLVTLQRKANSRGYYAYDRYSERGGANRTDEIALNPEHFAQRTNTEILSTLVHEMVHLAVARMYDKPPKSGYHCRTWGRGMKAVGLYPSDTGAPGGKETGVQMTHYIVEGGPFERHCAEFLRTVDFPLYVSLWDDGQRKAARKKLASKTKFTCEECGCNAWGKPDLNIKCGDCNITMTCA